MSTNILRHALPRLVGYAELADAYGWAPRTLQRWVKAGLLERPTRMPGGRVFWKLEQIEAFVGRQFSGLQAVSVTDPAKLLTTEEVEAQSRRFAAEAFERRTGRSVDPSDFCLNPIVDEEDFEAAHHLAQVQMAELLGSMDMEIAAVTACSILPQLESLLLSTIRSELRHAFRSEPANYQAAAHRAISLLEMRQRALGADRGEKHWMELLEQMRKFPLERAAPILIRFAPGLLPLVMSIRVETVDGKLQPLMDGEEQLSAVCSAALDDERWAELCRDRGWTGRISLPAEKREST